MGGRLRYGDAFALIAALAADETTLTGRSVKHEDQAKQAKASESEIREARQHLNPIFDRYK